MRNSCTPWHRRLLVYDNKRNKGSQSVANGAVLNNATSMKFLQQEDFKRKEAAKWLQDTRGGGWETEGSVGHDCKIIELTWGNDYTTVTTLKTTKLHTVKWWKDKGCGDVILRQGKKTGKVTALWEEREVVHPRLCFTAHAECESDFNTRGGYCLTGPCPPHRLSSGACLLRARMFMISE